MTRSTSICILGAAFVAVIVAAAITSAGQSPGGFHSPAAVAFSPDGKTLAVADATGQAVWLVPLSRGPKVRGVPTAALRGKPAALAWHGGRVYVAESGAGTIAEIDQRKAKVLRRISVGRYPAALAVAGKRGLLLTADSGLGQVSVVTIKDGATVAAIGVGRWPSALAVAPDESFAVVGHMIPTGASNVPEAAVDVRIVDLQKFSVAQTIPLPAGSAAVRGVVVAPSGRWAYVSHLVGRTNIPTTQLDRGWVITNALTVIDLQARTRYATVLLDGPSQGAANPWGLAVSADGKRLWVSLSGVHDIARIDLAKLTAMLAKLDGAGREALVNDLAALHRGGLLERFDSGGIGPRGLAISPDGKTLAAANYFSESVAAFDTDTGRKIGITAVAPAGKIGPVRRGEMLFYDARQCYQKWLSCVSCHPAARADGLNWDLLNDGMGNAKNTKSLLWSHRTPAAMSTGVRDSAETAVRAGFRHIQFAVVPQADTQAVDSYLKSLEPLPSPHLHKGKLSAAAARGKTLFHDKTVGCSRCHDAPLWTDLKLHAVGTGTGRDRETAFDTPTLVELWRTSPYLHNGSAATLRDVLTTGNAGDKHGKTSHLRPEQIDDLVAYLQSL